MQFVYPRLRKTKRMPTEPDPLQGQTQGFSFSFETFSQDMFNREAYSPTTKPGLKRPREIFSA